MIMNKIVPQDYGGMDRVYLPSEHIWYPQFFLLDYVTEDGRYLLDPLDLLVESTGKSKAASDLKSFIWPLKSYITLQLL